MRKCLILLILFTSQVRATTAPSTLRIIMTVDWEGDDLRTENLKAVAQLRQEFPNVPLLHYMNAAYFTKKGADRVLRRQQIQSTLLPGDQFGIHIHGWKSLFEAARVPHRTTPTWEQDGQPGSVKDCRLDCGFEIPINAYTYEELRRVLQTSKTILSEQGFPGLKHFRAGGWVTSPALLEALAAEGFKTDSSAVPVDLIADPLRGMNLLRMLRSYWPHISPASQPYLLNTTKGPLWEVPDNAALADYMESKDALKVVEQGLQNPKVNFVIAGFHQETADDWQDRVRGFLQAAEKLSVTFTTMPESFP